MKRCNQYGVVSSNLQVTQHRSSDATLNNGHKRIIAYTDAFHQAK